MSLVLTAMKLLPMLNTILEIEKSVFNDKVEKSVAVVNTKAKTAITELREALEAYGGDVDSLLQDLSVLMEEATS